MTANTKTTSVAVLIALGLALTARAELDLPAEWRRQYADLQSELGRRDWYKKVAAQVYDEQALVLPADRDAVDVTLRRTEALLREVQALGPKYDLTAAAKELARLKQMAATTPPATVAIPTGKTAKPKAAPLPAEMGPREALFVEIGKARRQIALANPLLDFNQLLFIKRAGTGAGHMCDQYYGKDNQATVHRSIEQLVTAPEADFPPSSADVDAGAHPRDQ